MHTSGNAAWGGSATGRKIVINYSILSKYTIDTQRILTFLRRI